MNNKINETKKWFDEYFSDRDEYNSQTGDENQLDAIISALQIGDGKCKILDIGTGTGFLAFGIAERYKNAAVTGLDIVEETLKINHQKVSGQNIRNLDFVSYDGSDFPFDNGFFDIVVTRYALHHFPDIKNSFSEISRVLKKDGKLLVSDPIPAENDNVGFVDEYMKLKKDGHIKFYTENELVGFASGAGLTPENSFKSQITFPRINDYGGAYTELIASYDENIINQYRLSESEDGKYIFITTDVMNSLFIKK